MIRLNQLLKEETFTATNKQSGKTSVFKSKDSRDAAIKAGTHDAIKDKSQPSTPKVAGSNMFGADYAKNRGGEAPKANKTTNEPKKSAEKADNVIKGLKPTKYGGKHPDSMESGGSLFRINKKGQRVRDREVRLKDITPEDISNTEKLFGVDLSKGAENGLDYQTNSLIIQYKRLQQFDKGGEFENKESYDSLLKNIKSYSAKDYKKEIDKAEKKKASSGKYATKYDDPSYWKDDERSDSSGYSGNDDGESDDSWSDDAQLTADRLDKIETAIVDDLKLEDNGFTTSRESGGGAGGWEGPMQIYDKSSDNEDGDPPVISLSVGSPNNDGKFSIVFANVDGEAYFEPDYDALTGDRTLTAKQAYKITKSLMQMPDVQKLLKGQITTNDFQSTYDKIKSKLTESVQKEGVIRLTKLMENDPCWKGYKQVGMKNKNGKEVPNCVPNESVVNEVGVNKMYVKFLAVSKKVRELEDAQKVLAQKYFAEKDLNKKEALLTQLKKGTDALKSFRRNLSDIEEKYVMNLDADTDYDV